MKCHIMYTVGLPIADYNIKIRVLVVRSHTLLFAVARALKYFLPTTIVVYHLFTLYTRIILNVWVSTYLQGGEQDLSK